MQNFAWQLKFQAKNGETMTEIMTEIHNVDFQFKNANEHEIDS